MLIGQQHVQKVPQWYHETVGFWDGTTLIAWTANIQAWTQHTMFENSGKLEAVEMFTPADDSRGKLLGLDEEAVFRPGGPAQITAMTSHGLRRPSKQGKSYSPP